MHQEKRTYEIASESRAGVIRQSEFEEASGRPRLLIQLIQLAHCLYKGLVKKLSRRDLTLDPDDLFVIITSGFFIHWQMADCSQEFEFVVFAIGKFPCFYQF